MLAEWQGLHSGSGEPGGARTGLYYITLGWKLRSTEIIANAFFRSEKPKLPFKEPLQPDFRQTGYWVDDRWILLLDR